VSHFYIIERELVAQGPMNALIPWAAIKSHRPCVQGDEQVLELAVTYSQEPERLYLPLSLKTGAISEEIERRAPKGVA
jgi:hypothetical protein